MIYFGYRAGEGVSDFPRLCNKQDRGRFRQEGRAIRKSIVAG